MICVDIWGGFCSGDHLARYMLPVAEALQLAARALGSGFLVNLRKEVAWEQDQNSDASIE